MRDLRQARQPVQLLLGPLENAPGPLLLAPHRSLRRATGGPACTAPEPEPACARGRGLRGSWLIVPLTMNLGVGPGRIVDPGASQEPCRARGELLAAEREPVKQARPASSDLDHHRLAVRAADLCSSRGVQRIVVRLVLIGHRAAPVVIMALSAVEIHVPWPDTGGLEASQPWPTSVTVRTAI